MANRLAFFEQPREGLFFFRVVWMFLEMQFTDEVTF